MFSYLVWGLRRSALDKLIAQRKVSSRRVSVGILYPACYSVLSLLVRGSKPEQGGHVVVHAVAHGSTPQARHGG